MVYTNKCYLLKFLILWLTDQVYDVASDTWVASLTDLPTDLEISDLSGFPGVNEDYAYFCGGYNYTYTAQSTCFAIDTMASMTDVTTTTTTNTTGFVVVRLASLNKERGDISSVYVPVNTDAGIDATVYLTGGFSHLDDYCDPVTTAEAYDVETDSWKVIANVNLGRGDQA